MSKSQQRNDEVIRKIATRLKTLRNAKGFSQLTVYKQTDQNIGRIEAAQSNITISSLEKLCRFYGISLKEFFKGI